jgi:hypothetical protein
MDDNFNSMDYGETAFKLKKNDGSVVKLGDVLAELTNSLTDLNTLLENINNVLNQSMGKNGAVVIDDTNAHIGEFTSLYVVTEAIVTTVGDITMTALTLPEGACIPFNISSITLGGGIVIAFGAETP